MVMVMGQRFGWLVDVMFEQVVVGVDVVVMQEWLDLMDMFVVLQVYVVDQYGWVGVGFGDEFVLWVEYMVVVLELDV